MRIQPSHQPTDMRHFTLLFVLFLCTCVRAQNVSPLPTDFSFPEEQTRVYPVSARLVAALHDWQTSVSRMPPLPDPYPAGYPLTDLPPGNYLSVTLREDRAEFRHFDTYRYAVTVEAEDGKFQLRLHDPAGQFRDDATVLADGKPVRYSRKHRAYRRRDWRVHTVQIAIDNDTLFSGVANTINRSRFAHDLAHLGRTEPILTLRRPWFVGKAVYETFRDGIFRDYWHWPHYYPLKNTIHRLTHPGPLTGYVAASQPRYRPGDSLKITAYLTYPKGRPLNRDSLTMTVATYGRGSRHRFTTRIGRAEKGRYYHAMAIPADWPLDQEYTVSFRQRRGRSITPTLRFRLEDYELAEYRLAVTASEDARLPGTAWVDVKADDVNGLSLPDGTIGLTVLLDRFVASRDTRTLVLPDTLWTHVQPTDNRIDHRIVLPDSLFPAGHSVRVRVRTQLTAPSGEYQETTTQLVVDRRFPLVPKLTLRGDSLSAYLAPADSVNGRQISALLQTILPAGDTLTQPLVLPALLPLDHGVAEYRLVYGPQSATTDLTELRPTTGNPAYWSRDTLLLGFPNPHAQPLRWTLTDDNDRVLATQAEHGGTYVRSGFAPGTHLELAYAYRAGGHWQHERRTLTTPRYDLLTEHKNVLSLTLEQPERVAPGSTVRVAVRATDQRGRPAAGVRLSAGTYNARFDKMPVTPPSYRSKTKRERQRQGYRRKDFRLSRSVTPPRWVLEDFGLDSALAYRLRYPDPEFTYERDLDTLLPVGVEEANFVPFVILHNEPITVRAVWLDDRLVYWYHPNITTSYSIPVPAGQHTVSIRIHNYQYTRKLNFTACRQLVLSFDAKRWVSAGWVREKKDKWTNTELKAIHEGVFALSRMQSGAIYNFKSGPAAMVQSARTNRYTEWSPLGLAQHRQTLSFYFPQGDSLEIPFERGATYRIDRQRERLYPLDREVIAQAQRQSATNGPRQPGLPQYVFHPPLRPGKSLFVSAAQRLPRLVRLEPRSRFQFTGLPDSLLKVVVAPVGENKFYFTNTTDVNTIAPGAYDLLYHFVSDSVFHQRIVFGEDSLTLICFDRSALRHFSNFDRLDRYTNARPPKEPEVTYDNLTFNGNLISGTVRGDKGEPLIGVTVLIVGTRRGTVTDSDGHFTLEVPAPPFELSVAYIGYATHRVVFTEGNPMHRPLELSLEPSVEMLDEVVVVGYGVQYKQNLTASVVSISSDDLQTLPRRSVTELIAARAAGVSVSDDGDISIRGSRANAVDYYVDGVRITGGDVPDSQIAYGAGQTLRIRGLSTQPPAGMLYVVDGKIVEDLSDVDQGQIASVNVLRDAASTAVYGARGANGVVVIVTRSGAERGLSVLLPPVELRDNFSDYAAFVPERTTGADGRAEFDVTFPDDITAWNTFTVGQDRRRRIGLAVERTQAFLPFQAQLYLPRFLVEGDSATARTLAINREGGERRVRQTFSAPNQAARTQDAVLVDGSEARYPIVAPSGTDSLTYRFTVQTLDGPPAADGEERSVRVYPRGTETVSGVLLLLGPDKTRLPTDFIRPDRGPVTLRLPGNRVQQLLNDLDRVVRYPYGCTEQTASRLVGLLQLKAVRDAQEAPVPEAKEIPKMIARLGKLRRADGGYGWWPGSESASPWISQHVYRALHLAETAGFPVADLTTLRRYLFTALPDLTARGQLDLLLTLAETGHPPTPVELARIDTFSAPNDYELLALSRLHQLRGDTIDVQRLLDSSRTHAAHGRYWGRRGFWFYRQPLDGRLACGLLARRILADAGHSEQANETVNYLLGQTAARNRPGNVPLLGTNTYESARLLAELLPVLLAEDGGLDPPAVTLTSPTGPTRITDFPYEAEYAPEAAAALRLQRAGSGPLPVALYQRWFETAPTAHDAGFSLTTRLTDARGRPLDELTEGVTAYLEVDLTARDAADYVLLEVPIPAGCSFANRQESRGPFAVHREYRRDRLAVFCDRLPAGTHTYRVALAPRFTGRYTLNPARAEMQYLPVVNGNGEVEEVRVR